MPSHLRPARSHPLSRAVLLAVAAAAACGTPDAERDGGAHDGSARAEQTTASSAPCGAAPLTAADVERYLVVMRAAAERRRTPTADERALLGRADALRERAITKGLPATAEAAEEANALLAQADTLRQQMDVPVVRARGDDVDCWLALRERVESIVPVETIGGASGFIGDESGAPAWEPEPPADPAEQAERRRESERRAADSVVVTPRRQAIEDALRGVRAWSPGGA